MKSYIFPVVVEQDEDRWSSYVPGLVDKGATSWGETKEEALKNIHEVAEMVIESLLEHDEPIPPEISVSDQPMLAVNV